MTAHILTRSELTFVLLVGMGICLGACIVSLAPVAVRLVRERRFTELCETKRDFDEPEPEWVDVFESTPIFDAGCWDQWEQEMSDR